MDDKINENINLEEKLNSIRTLFDLIDNIKNDRKDSY